MAVEGTQEVPPAVAIECLLLQPSTPAIQGCGFLTLALRELCSGNMRLRFLSMEDRGRLALSCCQSFTQLSVLRFWLEPLRIRLVHCPPSVSVLRLSRFLIDAAASASATWESPLVGAVR